MYTYVFLQVYFSWIHIHFEVVFFTTLNLKVLMHVKMDSLLKVVETAQAKVVGKCSSQYDSGVIGA